MKMYIVAILVLFGILFGSIAIAGPQLILGFTTPQGYAEFSREVDEKNNGPCKLSEDGNAGILLITSQDKLRAKARWNSLKLPDQSQSKTILIVPSDA